MPGGDGAEEVVGKRNQGLVQSHTATTLLSYAILPGQHRWRQDLEAGRSSEPVHYHGFCKWQSYVLCTFLLMVILSRGYVTQNLKILNRLTKGWG